MYRRKYGDGVITKSGHISVSQDRRSIYKERSMYGKSV